MKNNLFCTLCILLLAACSGDENNSGGGDTPEPEPVEALSFTATLADSSPFKSAWGQTDGLLVNATVDGKLKSELFKPGTISTDCKTGTFTSSGGISADAGRLYVYLTDAGITSFRDGSGWITADMNGFSKSPKAVLAGFSDTRQFSLKNLYSAVKVTVESDQISTLVFEGRESETVNRENVISMTDLTVSPTSSPSFEQTSSINGYVSGAGDYYVNLYPGLTLASGYKISAYNSKGSLLGVSESKDRLESVSGAIFNAPSIEEIPKTKEFNPAEIEYSFGVISDVHLAGEASTESGTKLQHALEVMQSQAKKDNIYGGLNAVLVNGDLMHTPCNDPANYVQADWFKAIYESVFSPVSVPMIYSVGNHDTYGWWSSATYSEALNISSRLGDSYFLKDLDMEMFRQYQCRHCKVGDYHILCVSPNSSSPVLYPSAITNWLDSELQKITSENPEQYVLVLTHPMIYNTVYGSTLGTYWYTAALSDILKKYPQVIVFGGHLHFPINDPRSIWQGDFTSVGTGSVRYMAIEDGGYEYMSSETVMKDAYDISSGHLVQIDRSGNVRITRMFFSWSAPFSGNWTISYPTSDRSHLLPYRFDTRKGANTPPSLSSLDVNLTGSTSEKTVTASFASGSDDEFVHHYLITLTRNGTAVATKKILADFYRHKDPSEMQENWTVEMGTFSAGDYVLTLVAYDSWDAESAPVTKSFSISE